MAIDLQALDFSLAAQFAGWAMADEVQRRLAADGFGDARVADGVLIQHVVDGPRTVTDLAERLGVTQQAASKAVADLERRGYVGRTPDPEDARARRVALTDRGRAVVEAARAHRAALAGELADLLGYERLDRARQALLEVVSHLGAGAAVRARRVRPPL
jgi:DNA-binding MarR family transcriptional regulator